MRKIVACFFLSTDAEIAQLISGTRHFWSRRLADERLRVFDKALRWSCFIVAMRHANGLCSSYLTPYSELLELRLV